MPPERVLRFLLHIWASFRGLSPAPSHHLGVDVFVGTFGCPVVVLDVGDQSVHRDLLSLCGALAQETGEARRRARMGSGGSSRTGRRHAGDAAAAGERATWLTDAESVRRGAHLDRQIDEKVVGETIKPSGPRARTTNSERTPLLSLNAVRCHLERLGGPDAERPGYVLRLGVLVSARGLLYQSKPSIEATHVNTPSGTCKADLRPLAKCVAGPGAVALGQLGQRFRTYLSLRSKRHRTPHYVLRNSP